MWKLRKTFITLTLFEKTHKDSDSLKIKNNVNAERNDEILRYIKNLVLSK